MSLEPRALSLVSSPAALCQTAVRVLPAYRCILPSRLKLPPAASLRIGSAQQSMHHHRASLPRCLAATLACRLALLLLFPSIRCRMTPARAATLLALQRPPPHPSARTAQASFQAPHIDQVHSRFVAPPSLPWHSALPARSIRPGSKYTSRLRLRPDPFPPISSLASRPLYRARTPSHCLVATQSLGRHWLAVSPTPTHLPEIHLEARPAHRNPVTSSPPESYSHPSVPLALLYPSPLRGTRRATSPPALHVLRSPPDLDLVEDRLDPAASSTPHLNRRPLVLSFP